MRKIRDVLVCIFKNQFSDRKTAKFTGLSRPTVAEYKTRFKQSRLAWPLPDNLDDDTLEKMLFPESTTNKQKNGHAGIDYAYIDIEMKKKGATLLSLYEEIIDARHEDPAPVGYTQFTRTYSKFKKQLRISLRQSYCYGLICFVDYAGHTIKIYNVDNGEVSEAQIFVGVLGGSYFTFAEATFSQKSCDWVESHVRMFEFFGGVPSVTVHDNLRSAVNKADRFSPVLNETYLTLCRHYGTHPFAARAYKPKDKPRVEAAVLLVERWILFRLRKQKFFSLTEVNKSIRQLLDKLNNKKFQKLHGSRFSQWLEHEKLYLQPLPIERYEFAAWGKVRAGTDYHAVVDEHAYSVPHQYRSQELEYQLTSTTIHLYLRRKIVAQHKRSYVKGGATTDSAHRTTAHGAVADWSVDESVAWAREIGPSTENLFSIQLPKLNNHHFGYRFLGAFKRLAREYGLARLEEVCKYGIENNVLEVADLRNILSKNLDLFFASASREADRNAIAEKTNHINVRGSDHYSQILNDENGEK